MLRNTSCVLLVGAMLAGCGDDGSQGPAASTTTAPASSASASAGRDKLPEQPQVALDFRTAELPDVEIDRAARGRVNAGALELELREAATARAAPVQQPPDVAVGTAQTVVVTARLREPRRLGGRAGVFCHSDGKGGGYELTVDGAGLVRLDRVAGGRRTTLVRTRARLEAADPPDSPVPLILVCCSGDEPAESGVFFAVGAQALSGVRDPSPLSPDAGSRAGMVLDGKRGDSALFTVFTLTYGP